jgi:hypothetical protein
LSWKINEDKPGKLEPYDWHSANDADQVQSETQSLRDLRIKPANLDFDPQDLQVPADQLWNINDDPTQTGWYVYGEIME